MQHVLVDTLKFVKSKFAKKVSLGSLKSELDYWKIRNYYS